MPEPVSAFLLTQLRRHRLMAVFRGVSPHHAPRLAEHLHRAGIRMLEVAFSDEFGPQALKAVRAALGDDVQLGAGTVTTTQRAEAALEAGATFILTPHIVPEVNLYAVQHGLGLISGATTPTEIQAARAQGSEVVKLFPAGDLGVGYLRSLLGPYPDLPLLVVGNVNKDNLAGFIGSGAIGAGIGSYLTPMNSGEPDIVLSERRARELLEVVEAAQEGEFRLRARS